MKLQIISDTHFGIRPDRLTSFVESLVPGDADVLVLAGDIDVEREALEAVRIITNAVAPLPVVWVHGNHEYYRGTRQRMIEETKRLQRTQTNLHFLDKEIVELAGRRILGTTLWYPDPTRHNWSDYAHIHNFWAWGGSEAGLCRDFIRENLTTGDIVVTHMLPSALCLHPNYIGDPDNVYFIHDMTDLILEREPALWVHGHTHACRDVQIGNTRVVCNPMGYPNETLGSSGILEVIVP